MDTRSPSPRLYRLITHKFTATQGLSLRSVYIRGTDPPRCVLHTTTPERTCPGSLPHIDFLFKQSTKTHKKKEARRVSLMHGENLRNKLSSTVVARRHFAKIYKRRANRVNGFANKIHFSKFQQTAASKQESRAFYPFSLLWTSHENAICFCVFFSGTSAFAHSNDLPGEQGTFVESRFVINVVTVLSSGA